MKHTACNLKQKKAGENIKQWHKASNMQIRTCTMEAINTENVTQTISANS